MTFGQLIEKIDSFYPDGFLMQYLKDPGGSHVDRRAKFIVDELEDTFDPAIDDEHQLAAAIEAIGDAEDELGMVTRALMTMRDTEWLTKHQGG